MAAKSLFVLRDLGVSHSYAFKVCMCIEHAERIVYTHWDQENIIYVAFIKIPNLNIHPRNIFYRMMSCKNLENA